MVGTVLGALQVSSLNPALDLLPLAHMFFGEVWFCLFFFLSHYMESYTLNKKGFVLFVVRCWMLAQLFGWRLLGCCHLAMSLYAKLILASAA